MSVVTNIMITTSIEEPAIAKLNALLSEKLGLHKDNVFKEVSDGAGGIKAIEAEIWLCAFNYLDMGQFLECFTAVRGQWEWPESVRVFIKFDQGEGFEQQFHLQMHLT